MERLAFPFSWRNVGDFREHALIHTGLRAFLANTQILQLEDIFKEKDLPKVTLGWGWARAQTGLLPRSLWPMAFCDANNS